LSKSAVVLLSGGLDSMVCAALAREAGFRVIALTVDYNQRHRVEHVAANRLAAGQADRGIGADRRHRRAQRWRR
jgi:7-cyano-7-deazaguanine synthase